MNWMDGIALSFLIMLICNLFMSVMLGGFISKTVDEIKDLERETEGEA